METRPKLIVIHGVGSSLAEAIGRVRGLMAFRCAWQPGAFVVDRRTGALLRQLLDEPAPGGYARALQQLAIGRFLESSGREEAASDSSDGQGRMRFDEARLLDDFAAFGIPFGLAGRRARAAQLQQEALAALAPLMPALDRLAAELHPPDGTAATEAEARAAVERHAQADPAATGLAELLDALRGMVESGGDLDTLASAALYTHWLRGAAAAAGRDCRHGRDYSYAFLNYHERLDRLDTGRPADVLLADLPLGALPDFEADARRLAPRGLRLARFEDHHPWTPEQEETLTRLGRDGLLDFFELGGPPAGTESHGGSERCGADLVYANTIAGTAWDTPGAQRLRAIAHSEDFVTTRTDTGRLLTTLIKGGACKLELVQLLADTIPGDDLDARLRNGGWAARAAGWTTDAAALEPELRQTALVLEFQRPDRPAADAGGPAPGPGSDMPLPRAAAAAAGDTVRIVAALAVPRRRTGPRITIGTVVECAARTLPQADYLFYCHGASLLVARRLNQADLSLNLGALMPVLGNAGDGGHAGAAVCRPESSPAYPRAALPSVNAANFRIFARWLAERLGQAGYACTGIRAVPRPKSGDIAYRSDSRILVVTLVALAAGLLLVLFHPKFRPAAIRETNRDFVASGFDAPAPAADDTEGRAP